MAPTNQSVVADGSPTFIESPKSIPVGEWFRLRLTVENIADTAKATLEIFNSTSVFDDTTRLGTRTLTFAPGALTGAGEVGVITNLNGIGNTQDWDDFTVTAIPEPASLGLLALGGLLIASRRRDA